MNKFSFGQIKKFDKFDKPRADSPRIFMIKIWAQIRNNSFINAATVLGGGALLAQLITVAVSPILTRLYTPSDFGLLAILIAITGSLSPLANGKYDVSIVLSKSNEERGNLFGISILFVVIFSLILFFGFQLFQDQIRSIFGAENLGQWILFVPLCLFSIGILSSLNFYSNSLRFYKVMSTVKISVAVISAIIAIFFGIFGEDYGLLIAAFTANTMLVIFLFYLYRKTLRQRFFLWDKGKFRLMKEYKDFPIYNASTALLDGLTIALPIFFLSKYFPDSTVGYYSLMVRVAMAPVGFLSFAISEVNLKKMSNMINSKQRVLPYFLRLSFALILIISPIFLLVGLFSNELFDLVFGNDWVTAGEYLKILMPALALRCLVSMLSSTFAATRNNKLAAYWKVGAFLFTFSVFYIFSAQVSVISLLHIMLWTDLFLYSIYYALLWKCVVSVKNTG